MKTPRITRSKVVMVKITTDLLHCENIWSLFTKIIYFISFNFRDGGSRESWFDTGKGHGSWIEVRPRVQVEKVWVGGFYLLLFTSRITFTSKTELARSMQKTKRITAQ